MGLFGGYDFSMCIFMGYFICKVSILGVYLLCVEMKFQFFLTISLSKHNRTRYQANTHRQRHMNTAWSEMITCTPCMALYCTFPPQFIQCIWDISTPISHKPYGYIWTLFILIPLTITILWLQVTKDLTFNTPTFVSSQNDSKFIALESDCCLAFAYMVSKHPI